MSDVWVVERIGDRASRIAVGLFDFFIRDISDRPEAKILQYYSEYQDQVVSPPMLDAFEHDVHMFVDEVVVWAHGVGQKDPLAFLDSIIATAREHRAYIVLMGD